MSLVETIKDDLKEAMKARDEFRKAVLRSLKSAIDKEAIDSGKELDDKAVLTVIKRAHKQRKEAATLFEQGGAEDKAKNELAEAELINTYLPAQLSNQEIQKHVDEVIEQMQASAPSDQGKVMGKLSAVLGGKADMKTVAQLVKDKLAN